MLPALLVVLPAIKGFCRHHDAGRFDSNKVVCIECSPKGQQERHTELSILPIWGVECRGARRTLRTVAGNVPVIFHDFQYGLRTLYYDCPLPKPS